MKIKDFEQAIPAGIILDHIYLGTIDGQRNQVKLCKAHHSVKREQYVFNARGECFVLDGDIDFENEMKIIEATGGNFFYFVTNTQRAHRDETLDLNFSGAQLNN